MQRSVCWKIGILIKIWISSLKFICVCVWRVFVGGQLHRFFRSLICLLSSSLFQARSNLILHRTPFKSYHKYHQGNKNSWTNLFNTGEMKYSYLNFLFLLFFFFGFKQCFFSVIYLFNRGKRVKYCCFWCGFVLSHEI